MQSTDSHKTPSLGILGACWAIACAATVALMGVALWFGDLNQDEGWYLYAGGEVARGRFPFIDFATTQGPVMPFVYALATPLVARLGVVGGRLFTALLGMGAALGAAWLAACLLPKRRGRGMAALMGFCLVGVNVYQCYFCTIVKTYALTGLLLVAAFAVLTYARRGGPSWALLSGILMALAAGTRSSAGFAGLAAFLGLAWAAGRERRRPAAVGMRDVAVAPASAASMCLWLTIGGAIGGLAIFGPFAVLAPRGIWFALVEYHAGREVGSAAVQLAYKAGFVSRVASAYLVSAGLLLCGLLVLRFQRSVGPQAGAQSFRCQEGSLRSARRASPTIPHGRVGPPARPSPIRQEDDGTGEDGLMSRLVWAAIVLVSLVHFLAPFPYDDYQTIIYPLAAAALAQGLVQWAARRDAAEPSGGGGRQASWMAVSVLGLCLLAAGASPMTWQWFLGERDRIWWPLKEKTPVAVLREAGAFLRERTERGDLLLTQDTYLAVEARLRVPEGLELGPFSYFPDWTSERAAALHVLNHEMLRDLLLDSHAAYAAFSGYGLSIRCPEVAPLPDAEVADLRAVVARQYDEIRRWRRFGQAETELVVLARKGLDL